MTSSADKKPRPFVKIKNLTELGHGLMGVLMHPPLLTFFGIFIYPLVCGLRKSMLTGKFLGPKVPPMEFFDNTHFSRTVDTFRIDERDLLITSH